MEIELSVYVTLAAGCLMILAGLQKRSLGLRNPARRCPSCGRFKRECRCVA
jgi:hypothetical protein